MLRISDLSVSRGAIPALTGVSLHVARGEIVALIGGNGAGKTAVLRAASGLVRPNAGQIEFLGRNLAGLSPHAIVALGLGHVPEGRQVFPQLTVNQNLAMGAHLISDREKIAANLDQVLSLFPRLKDRLKQAAGTLSSGEQQMLDIGRALMGNPVLLMLDEPSLGIAPRLVTTIYETIVSLNRSHGLTLLLSEQNARLALEISSRVHVFEAGRVVISGPGSDLRNDPRVRAAYLGG